MATTTPWAHAANTNKGCVGHGIGFYILFFFFLLLFCCAPERDKEQTLQFYVSMEQERIVGIEKTKTHLGLLDRTENKGEQARLHKESTTP